MRRPRQHQTSTVKKSVATSAFQCAQKHRPRDASPAGGRGFDQVILENAPDCAAPNLDIKILQGTLNACIAPAQFSWAIRTTSCSMSILVRGLPGRRRSKNVHFRATSCRCQRNKVAGETSGSRSLSAQVPIALASVARVLRSASLNESLRRPSLDRSSRFSAFKYSICAAACRSSQQPMLAMSSARKVRGFHAINCTHVPCGRAMPYAKPCSRCCSERPIDRITIRDICEKAGVHYATFFRHHQTKEALLDYIAKDQIKQLNKLTLAIRETDNYEAGFCALCAYVA